MTREQLDALWRPSPDFIGPLMPPMLLWFARGRPKDLWQINAEARGVFPPGIDDLPLFAAVIDAPDGSK